MRARRGPRWRTPHVFIFIHRTCRDVKILFPDHQLMFAVASELRVFEQNSSYKPRLSERSANCQLPMLQLNSILHRGIDAASSGRLGPRVRPAPAAAVGVAVAPVRAARPGRRASREPERELLEFKL